MAMLRKMLRRFRRLLHSLGGSSGPGSPGHNRAYLESEAARHHDAGGGSF